MCASPLVLTVAELLEREPGELGVSDWLTVDQSRIGEFARATDDNQWIHVDPERAADGPFGTTIAHGYLLLSLVPRMLKDVFRISNQARGTNYGVEKVRFTSPVAVDSQLRLHVDLAGTSLRDDGGVRYRIAFRIEVEGQERPAAVGDVLYLTYPV